VKSRSRQLDETAMAWAATTDVVARRTVFVPANALAPAIGTAPRGSSPKRKLTLLTPTRKDAVRASSSLLATNLPLLPASRLAPRGSPAAARRYVLRRDVAYGPVLTDVVVTLDVILHQSPPTIERQWRSRPDAPSFSTSPVTGMTSRDQSQ